MNKYDSRTIGELSVQSRIVVTGAGGFIGHHLVKFLKDAGYWVRGVDMKYPEFEATSADEFLICDLRDESACRRALTLNKKEKVSAVYNLAADMGGMGFIHSAEREIMRNNALININLPHCAALLGITRYFFSSSVCIYRDMQRGEPELREEDAYPALPDNEYGWEKLYAERIALTHGRHSGMQIRIARFQNCYGPLGAWTGGREKAPAALCRKVAEASDGDTIEIWGDGSAVRAYTYVSDMVDAVFRLMNSEINEPANIGTPEYVSVNDLVALISKVAGKKIKVNSIAGPVGVQSRNFSNERIFSAGWRPRVSLEEGIGQLYRWVESQVQLQRQAEQLDRRSELKRAVGV